MFFSNFVTHDSLFYIVGLSLMTQIMMTTAMTKKTKNVNQEIR